MKRMPTLISIFCLLVGFNFYSCHDTLTVIHGCCEDPPINVKVGIGRVWVANVFTPNGDGLHDRMFIYGDSMREIIHLEIKNKDRFVVMNNEHLPFNTYVWDGKVLGKVERGLYSFTMDVEAMDYTIKTIKGHICNCPCDQMGDEDFKPISNCEFGLCDPNWTDCMEIETLPCFKH